MSDPGPATIAVAASRTPEDLPVRQAAATAVRAAQPDVAVALVESEDLRDHRGRFAAQLLTAMSNEVDVYEVDVADAAALAPHAVALDGHVPADLLAAVDPATLDAVTVDGALVAVPVPGAAAATVPGRAFVVSRYSRAPAAAADVAVALARAAAAGPQG